MKDFAPATSFGEEIASRYDELAVRGDEDATVAFLEHWARGGRVLELAIGTGRIALPLAARGVDVSGIDLSTAMVARMRTKPAGNDIPVTIGDMSLVGVDGTFTLIYVIFNSFFNMLSQEEHLRCFENVAKHLTDDGVFVLEAGPPDWLYRLRDDQYVNAETIGVDRVTFDLLRHDPLTQTLEENHVFVTKDGGVLMDPGVQRYSWNSELDLMARFAGLQLKERWAGWERERYVAGSRNCIHVYGR